MKFPAMNQVTCLVIILQIGISEPGESTENSVDSNSPTNNNRLCRCRQNFLPPPLFDSTACALCYHYLPRRGHQTKTRWRIIEQTHKFDNNATYRSALLTNDSVTVVADPENPVLAELFSSEREITIWQQCCRAAKLCCQSQLLKSRPIAGMCPATWDGWQCWDSVETGSTAHAVCPAYIYARNPPECPYYAYKRCESSGQWYRLQLNDSTTEHSDYGTCTALQTLTTRAHVHVAANAASVLALIPALIIFNSYRQLSVHRIRMHGQFFASLLLNSLVVIGFECTFVLGLGQGSMAFIQNTILCRFVLLMTKYCRLSIYFWQFCESFYLHRLIQDVFHEQTSLVLYYVLGWGAPLLPVITYSLLSNLLGGGDCLVDTDQSFEWILYVPCLLCLTICTLFLADIIRVLVTKLRAQHSQESKQYRKAVKATLVLLPLFGLHLLLTIYRPSAAGCTWIEIYFYINHLLDGLQGVMVTLLFCYLNEEVQQVLMRSYRNRCLSQGSILRYQTCVYRLSNAECAVPQCTANKYDTYQA